MEHHVGIDVSLELSSLCVLDTARKVVREAKVASEPEALVAFLRKPRRHRPSLDPDLGVLSRMPSQCPLDLPWVRGALAAPRPATGLVDNADRRQLL